MKLSFLILFFVLPVVVFAGQPPLQKGTFTNSYGSRDYYLFAPKNPIALVVALHGCTQTAPEFSAQSGFTDLALKYGFAVVYPEQNYTQNIFKCWNWFKPENQRRSQGESSIIVDLTKKLISELALDRTKIFITGLSAGGAQAANIFACHSDLFSGLGVHSGTEFRAARSDSEAQQAMKNGSTQDLTESAHEAVKCSGPQAHVGRVVVVHGSEDNVVNPVNADRVVTQFSKINDLLDDGQDNGSHSANAISTGAGEVPGGYRYQTEHYGSASGEIFISKITVSGMKHAWSGSHSKGQYADPKGPDAAEIIWNFLIQAQ